MIRNQKVKQVNLFTSEPTTIELDDGTILKWNDLTQVEKDKLTEIMKENE